MTEQRGELLTEAQVAERLQVSVRSLRRWRATGEGPPWLKLSPRMVRYPAAELDAWLAARDRGSG